MSVAQAIARENAAWFGPSAVDMANEALDREAERAISKAEYLDDLEGDGWDLNPLESSRGFDRYAIGPETSFWACADCGAVDVDPDEGCHACGFGSDIGSDEE